MSTIQPRMLIASRLVLTVMLTAPLVAQQDPGGQQPAEPAAAANTPVPPPPGPEVMRPTRHGLRLTPNLSRALSASISREIMKDAKLSATQRKQFEEAFARRLMEIVRKHEEQAQPAIEYLFDVALRSEGRPGLNLTPESAREFAQRCAPLSPIAREIFDGLRADLEPVLDADQKAELDNKMKDSQEGLEHFEQTLSRWEQGNYVKGEDPFNKPKPAEQPGDPAAGAQNPSPQPEEKPEMRNAENAADFQMQQFGPGDWDNLTKMVTRYFDFSDDQKAKAEKLLKDYRAKANAVMTPEWKQAMRTNRIKSHLNYMVKDQPTRPFFYHLQRDYQAMIRPVKDMGLEFRRDLLALVTPEQKAAAQAELQQRAAEHGLQLEPTDETLLGLAGAAQPVAGAQ